MSELYDAGIPACPNCGQADRVQGVPAVYRAGVDTVSVHVPSTDERMAHTEQRTVTTALARSLAPAPDAVQLGRGCLGALPLGCLGFLLPLAGVVAYVVAVGAGHWRGDPPQDCTPQFSGPDNCNIPATPADLTPHGTYAWLGWLGVLLVLIGLLLVVGLMLRLRLVRLGFRRRLAGRPQAEAVWSRGWYCARCGTAHFRATPSEPSRPLSLGEFRQIVWNAGGYGDLVARYPVV
ncbi:hypothetical protein ABIA32_004695 [Streptacidiphilus sp. MAP12-20]|uniref:hypothetical protein n=1 Tax=Streptacidiphilus sp. MAP12-20 TaxID=3156299 RepID=UPI003516420D